MPWVFLPIAAKLGKPLIIWKYQREWSSLSESLGTPRWQGDNCYVNCTLHSLVTLFFRWSLSSCLPRPRKTMIRIFIFIDILDSDTQNLFTEPTKVDNQKPPKVLFLRTKFYWMSRIGWDKLRICLEMENTKNHFLSLPFFSSFHISSSYVKILCEKFQQRKSQWIQWSLTK